MKILLIIIDAFNEKYLEQTSYLESLNKSRMLINPTFANRIDLLTGKYPETTDTFVDFVLKRKDSIFSNFLPKKLKIKKRNIWIKRIIERLTGENYHNIPLFLFPYFKINDSYKEILRQEKYLSIKHPFGILNKNDYKTDFFWGTTNEINNFFKKFSFAKNHLLILHYSELDYLGHKFGTNSIEIENALKNIENSIKNISKSKIDYTFITSDHGMENINKNIDLVKEFKKLKSKPVRDYLFFLNSPLARFWFKNNKARNEVQNLLKKLDYGKIIEKKELQKNNLPVSKKYGELIFWCKKGFNINPDFYNAKKIKAMHGYLEKSYVPFLSPDKKLKNTGNIIDVMPTIFDLLKLKYNFDGKSSLK